MRDGGYGSNRFVCTSVILNSVARGLAHIRSMGGESGPLGRRQGYETVPFPVAVHDPAIPNGFREARMQFGLVATGN
jgi:hypothetical protein